MYFACINGDVEAVDALIKSGINLNQATNCTEVMSNYILTSVYNSYIISEAVLNSFYTKCYSLF